MRRDHDLSAALGRRRRQLGLSLSQLARRIRSSPATVHRYESGWHRFEIYTLQKLATALGCRLRITIEPIERRVAAPTPQEVVDQLRRLFWDADLEVEDLVEHPGWVVRRVLEMGNLQDVQALSAFAGRNGLLGHVRGLRFGSEKTEACWRAMLELEGSRCMEKSSRRAARISWPR